MFYCQFPFVNVYFLLNIKEQYFSVFRLLCWLVSRFLQKIKSSVMRTTISSFEILVRKDSSQVDLL